MNSYIGIDPGPTESAYVVIEPSPVKSEIVIIDKGKIPNEEFLRKCRDWDDSQDCTNQSKVGIEMIASYGMGVGEEVFETCVFIGRIMENVLSIPIRRIKRLEVKQHICHDSRAKDSNVRLALIDRYGSPGKKKSPGITYGLSGDMWAALAVAVTLMETEENQ